MYRKALKSNPVSYLAEQLNSFSGHPIADVLRIQDGNSKEWIPDLPILLRLENCDIEISEAPNTMLAVRIGSVDTEAPCALTSSVAAQNLSRGINSGSLYLRWASYRPFSTVIGTTVQWFSVLTDEASHIFEIKVYIEEMGALCVRAHGTSTIIEIAPQAQQCKNADLHASKPRSTT